MLYFKVNTDLLQLDLDTEKVYKSFSTLASSYTYSKEDNKPSQLGSTIIQII